MYHMIINPASRSGRGKQYWTILENYLNDHNINYTAHISQKLGHVTEIMRELTRSLDSNSEPIKVIVLGGDGTVNEALQGICNFEKAANVATKLFELEQNYIFYMYYPATDSLGYVQESLTALEAAYAELQGLDKISFEDLEDLYAYYVELCQSLITEA